MREMYDRLIAEGEAGMSRLVLERTQEFLELDFKRKENASNGEFSTNDRRMLAEALSGFANSAGGLLVIGVDARQGGDGIDCAQELRPIADIQRFLAETNTEVGRLVQPRLSGVEVAAIPSESQSGAGYLIVLIPRSERRPHRSEAKGQKSYHRRSGSAFFEMEHYDIEDAFSRTAVARIELRISSSGQMHISSDEYAFIFQVDLINVSETIAKFPFVSFRNFHGSGIYQRHYEPPYKFVPAVNGGSLVGGVNDVIHPGTHGVAGKIAVLFNRARDYQTSTVSDWRMMGERSPQDSPSVDYLFGCEGMRGETGRWSLDRAHLSPPR